METLFDVPKIEPVKKSEFTCQQCEHSQRWQCNSKVFHYCGVQKSNRTSNGLLKIKMNRQEQCRYYQPIQKPLINNKT